MSIFKALLIAMFTLFIVLDLVYIFIAVTGEDKDAKFAYNSLVKAEMVFQELKFKNFNIELVSDNKYKINLVSNECLDDVVLQLISQQINSIKKQIYPQRINQKNFSAFIYLDNNQRYTLNIKGYQENIIFFKKNMLYFENNKLQIK